MEAKNRAKAQADSKAIELKMRKETAETQAQIKETKMSAKQREA